MNLRNRTIPIPLKKLLAVLPRIRPGFPRLPELKLELKNRMKGFEGEKKIDYYLGFLASYFTILHDVYLEVNGKSFQIDSLIITKGAIFIIGMKDYTGKIKFDTALNQCIQIIGNQERGINCPITEAENHKLLLEAWLSQHNLSNIPIYYFIAFSDPSTIIDVKGDQDEISKVVAHGNQIPKMILDINKDLPHRLQDYKLGKAILRECGEFDFDILGMYQLTSQDIMPGVWCPACERLGMQRVQRSWQCPGCNHRAKDAHKQALEDYFLLINSTITNKAAMQFFKVNSRFVATRLLKGENLVYDSEKREWSHTPKLNVPTRNLSAPPRPVSAPNRE